MAIENKTLNLLRFVLIAKVVNFPMLKYFILSQPTCFIYIFKKKRFIS